MDSLAKYLFVPLIWLSGFQCPAQPFGIKAGLNLAKRIDKEFFPIEYEYAMIPGFHVGPVFEYPLFSIFSVETGLLLETKGGRSMFEISDPDYAFESTARQLYLDMPVTLKFRLVLSKALDFFGAFGAYLGMGLSGKIKTEELILGSPKTVEQEVKWGNTKYSDELKRFDHGLTFGGGLELNAVQIGISYDLGLANQSNHPMFIQEDLRFRVWRLSVAYKLCGS